MEDTLKMRLSSAPSLVQELCQKDELCTPEMLLALEFDQMASEALMPQDTFLEKGPTENLLLQERQKSLSILSRPLEKPQLGSRWEDMVQIQDFWRGPNRDEGWRIMPRGSCHVEGDEIVCRYPREQSPNPWLQPEPYRPEPYRPEPHWPLEPGGVFLMMSPTVRPQEPVSPGRVDGLINLEVLWKD